MSRRLVATILEILGLIAVVAGVEIVSFPAGLIVGGVFTIVYAGMLERA